jgi:hypothetical protein
MKVNKERVLNALKWLKKHHDGYHNIVITPENFWFDGEEVDMCKDASVIEIKTASKPRDEKVSECHDTDPMDDEDNAIELVTMHENENVRVPSGEQAEKVKDILETAKESGMSDKVLEFPPIDTEPVS